MLPEQIFRRQLLVLSAENRVICRCWRMDWFGSREFPQGLKPRSYLGRLWHALAAISHGC